MRSTSRPVIALKVKVFIFAVDFLRKKSVVVLFVFVCRKNVEKWKEG